MTNFSTVNNNENKEKRIMEWLSQIMTSKQAEKWPDEIPTELTLPLGKIRGVNHDGIRIFRGISYAEAPIGQLRFAPPKKLSPWGGIKDCTSFGPMSYQMGTGNYSEDCLNLNVWTPAESQEQALPVYVFIHGGAYSFGSGSIKLYESTEIAKAGIVVVTINYRLNALGFLPLKASYEEHDTTGNWGILDMICALEWVRDNIYAFGGDPHRVTIGGESAGAYAVSTLISSPRAKGLFNQAIMESGALPMTKSSAPSTAERERAMVMANQFAVSFGTEDSKEGLEYLRGVPAENIAAASLYTMGDKKNPQAFSFWPIADGSVIPENPIEEMKAGNINHVKLLAGFNTDEGSIFVKAGSTPADYNVIVHEIFGKNAQAVLERYPITDEIGVDQRISQITTLTMLRGGIYLYADALADVKEDVYTYHFDFVDPLIKCTGLGVPHTSELKFVFHNYMEQVNKDTIAKEISKQIYTAWTNFIKTGDPNKGIKLSHNIKWEKYTSQKRVEMHISEKCEMQELFAAEDVEFINLMMYGK